MKKTIILLLVLASCTTQKTEVRESVPLEGEWTFRIDSLDRGVTEQWFLKDEGEPITLPGSMAQNGKGEEVSINTPWTGDIFDRSYFTDAKYEKYRQPGNIKIPFWLKPDKYYKGVAWYQKEILIPENLKEKNITLFLERPHWETTVFVNGENAGTRNSLAVPHQFNITPYLSVGKNLVSIRVDNSVIIPVGVNSHSISDHTQGNWNGIAGEISLVARSAVSIDEVRIFPDVDSASARVAVSISNRSGGSFDGKIRLQAITGGKNVRALTIPVSVKGDRLVVNAGYDMGKEFRRWSEYDPAVYTMNVSLMDGATAVDVVSEDFGMRKFSTDGTRFSVNDQPVFLRGTTECCVFPLTGYPPSDTAYWMRILRICRDHGLNHMRFHSYCPPEAAFIAADRLGIYFHVECSSWANQGATIGDGGIVDKFIYDEGDRIIAEYGNHPSFCMMAYGNEPAGRNHRQYLGRLLEYWKATDGRRVYTGGAGWPVLKGNEYHLVSEPRIQQWGAGLKSIINAEPGQSMYDFSDYVSKFTVPVVSHEIGQWCVYPDFTEISKYTGPLKASNFEIFRETLEANNMGDQAAMFLQASGKLQALCYKAEIEAALRTPGFAGFQMLQLHDFPGQGTALVGILNPFFESKGYITADEFRQFCNETVPLARIPKMVLTSNEEFRADIEMFHFGAEPMKDAVVECRIRNMSGEELYSKDFSMDEIPRGNCIPVGAVSFKTDGIKEAQKLRLEVAVAGTSFRNGWDIWVYPEIEKMNPGEVLIIDNLDRKAEEKLASGGSVLLLAYGSVPKGKGAEVAIGFSSIFWNTAWTNNQPPHTLGIVCDPDHPLFKGFPTEFHSNWQWWDPVTHSQAMILDGMPAGLRSLVQPIDTWFSNRKLSLAFESKTGGGKLLVCSIDLKSDIENRPVAKALLSSVLDYMNGSSFNPAVELDAGQVKGLFSVN